MKKLECKIHVKSHAKKHVKIINNTCIKKKEEFRSYTLGNINQ